ncbi:hypothetical protein MLD38_030268 [Melastoma candidum]|uniref:Uncharacterized protein n=1 Tax=Melastoma candidum TaxID=119954 RepID=A0ACB9MN12_9MYRT|nr:hypothetical protein MLD38_030268 [Melastoma candidum]
MASALLASRIEPSWGDRKVYMKKYATNHLPPSSSPFPNPNPNPSCAHLFNSNHYSNPNYDRFRPDDDDELAVADDDAASFAPRSRFESDYITFKLGGSSRSELRDLKRRLVSELEQVRILRSRIESCSGSTGAGLVHHPPSQFSATDVAMESPRFKVSPPPKVKKGFSGSKRSSPFGGPIGSKDGSNLKKVREDNFTPSAASTSMMKRCGQILTKLMKHKHGWVFNEPVDAAALGLHDYHQIIKNPMDLGTVKKKLDRNVYSLPGDFAADIRLTFVNALTYNPRGHDVHAMADVLLSMFEQMYDQAYRKYEKETEKSVAGGRDEVKARVWEEDLVQETARREVSKTTRLSPKQQTNSISSPKLNADAALSNQDGFLVAEQVSSLEKSQAPVGVKRPKVGKLPKPKAKDPNKREMSFEEKAKLGMNLQNLPPEKIGQLLHIIRKRNKQFAQDGDEIELDIEAVDTETLWELDRFVCNYKKLVSKIKRQGLIHNQVSASEIINKSSPEKEVLELATQHKQKREVGGDEDVDIGDDIPMSSYPPVEIERDAKSNTSSSSSSSGDSSSSDSDSRSSSGSDSDADSVQSPFVGSKGAHGS